jgi:transposase
MTLRRQPRLDARTRERIGNPPSRRKRSRIGVLDGTVDDGSRRITKTGNARACRALTEAAWGYRYHAKVSPIIQKRLE